MKCLLISLAKSINRQTLLEFSYNSIFNSIRRIVFLNNIILYTDTMTILRYYAPNALDDGKTAGILKLLQQVYAFLTLGDR